MLSSVYTIRMNCIWDLIMAMFNLHRHSLMQWFQYETEMKMALFMILRIKSISNYGLCTRIIRVYDIYFYWTEWDHPHFIFNFCKRKMEYINNYTNKQWLNWNDFLFYFLNFFWLISNFLLILNGEYAITLAGNRAHRTLSRFWNVIPTIRHKLKFPHFQSN